MCSPKKTGHKLAPQTLVLHRGYEPRLSEGALNPPIFTTSTWVSETAESAEASFEAALGLPSLSGYHDEQLIYSRINHPNVQITEERLAVFDQAECCALFDSGMEAINVTLATFLYPGASILHNKPLYGGTTGLLYNHYSEKWEISVDGFRDAIELEIKILQLKKRSIRTKLVFIETPTNPTLNLVDISSCAEVASRYGALLVVDNTFLGPCFQHPLEHGADIVLYSATKFIGGHSSIIAGACLGSREIIGQLKKSRSSLGGITGMRTAAHLTQSLETLAIRMEKQMSNAIPVADFLAKHPKTKNIRYLGILDTHDPQYSIFKKQCTGTGSMISFDLHGGKSDIFRFLNALKVVKLAVSFGSTHSMACHPASTTHRGVPSDELELLGITNLVRLSVGLEDYKDLIWDIGQALEHV